MGSFFKVVIIDDEKASVMALANMLKGYSKFHVDGVAHDATSGISLIKKVMPDLLFLDVELPEMYGMELLGEVKGDIRWNMRVVFYTAHDKYMINALRNSAFDFLLKPIDRKELDIVISRFLADCENQTAISDRIGTFGEHKDSAFMVLLPTGEMRMIKASDVGFFKYASDRKLWEALLVTGETVPLRRNVSAEFLCAFDKKFVRVHQSYILNMDFLLMIHDNNCVLCPPFDNNTEVIVSRKYKKDLMENFCIF